MYYTGNYIQKACLAKVKVEFHIERSHDETVAPSVLSNIDYSIADYIRQKNL